MLRKLTARLSPVAILNAFAPVRGISVRSDIPFGDSGLSLDIYAPTNAKNAPIAVFIYGGGWDSGAKTMYRFVGAALAAQGIVTVIPQYRVHPEVRFPVFVEDAADATAWVIREMFPKGGAPVLIGHSAGAHIAAMLALDTRWLDERLGAMRPRLAGLLGISGPYDFLPLHSEKLKTILDTRAGLDATQPINFVRADAPPALLVAGKLDSVVDPQNSVRLARRIEDFGGTVTLKFYPFAGHANLIGAFAAPLRPLAPVLRDTVNFVNERSAVAVATGLEGVPCLSL